MSIPSRSWVAKLLHKLLPAELAHRVLRRRNIFLTDFLFRRSRNKPEQMKRFLHRSLKKELGDKYRAEDFSPPYNPWEERMCFISNGDLFRAMREDRASIVTGHIERIEFDGIRLKDGSHLPADIIVTATGLKLAVAGKIAVSVDGSPVEWSQRYFYKNALFSNIPNLSMVVAYLNASATLRMDLVANYVCRVLNHMDEHGYVSATPRIPPGTKLVDHDMFDFSSGYIQRSKHLVPKSSEEYPWKLSHNYRFDRKYMRQSPVEDGCLTFAEPSAKAAHEEALAAQ